MRYLWSFSPMRSTLTCFLMLIIIGSFSTMGWGQFPIHPDSSFYTFLDSFYFYNQDDSAEGGLYNQVRRDKWT